MKSTASYPVAPRRNHCKLRASNRMPSGGTSSGYGLLLSRTWEAALRPKLEETRTVLSWLGGPKEALPATTSRSIGAFILFWRTYAQCAPHPRDRLLTPRVLRVEQVRDHDRDRCLPAPIAEDVVEHRFVFA